MGKTQIFSEEELSRLRETPLGASMITPSALCLAPPNLKTKLRLWLYDLGLLAYYYYVSDFTNTKPDHTHAPYSIFIISLGADAV